MTNNSLIFFVWSPDYTDQYGGVIVLHKLAEELANLGEKTFIISNRTSPNSKAEKISASGTFHFANMANSYVIYPEVVSGNPLNFKNVIRFVLYKPGVNGGDKIYDKSEIVYSHTKYCVAGTPYENTPSLHCIDPKLDKFFDLGKARSDTCTLIKKGRNKNIYRAPNVIDSYLGAHNMDSMLQNIFNKFEYFLSYDSASYHSIQAALCGCISIVVPEEGLSKEEWIARQPIMKYGIAYGENDIQWAIDTKHMVRDHVLNYHQETLKTVSALRDNCYQDYKIKYIED